MINFLIEIGFTILLMVFVLSKIPQIFRLYKRKSSLDISIIQYWTVVIIANITIIYGFYKDSPSMIIANIANVIICGIILFQCYYYRRNKIK